MALRELYPWVLALYLLDCLVISRQPSWHFVRGAAGGWRLVCTTITIAGFMPWERRLHASIPTPIPAGDGLVGFPPGGGMWFRYRPAEALEVACCGEAAETAARIRAGAADLRLRHATETEREHLASLYERICRADPARRPLIAALALRRSLRVGRLRRRLALAQRALAPLQSLNSAFFVVILLLPPIQIALPLGNPVAVANLLLLAVLLVAVAGETYRVHRRLHPGNRSGRLALVATTLLFPPSAAHTAGVVAADLGTGFDWTAVGAATLGQREAERLVAAEIVRLELGSQSAGSDAVRSALAARRDAMGEMARREGFAAPLPANGFETEGADSGAWCPVCYAEFRDHIEACVDCGAPLRQRSA